MDLEIKKIRIKKRLRKDIGDIQSLVTSLMKFGLINPVIINPKYELLAGHRRILAAKKLKWKRISVKILETRDQLDKLNIEMEENIVRKNFTKPEMEHGLRLKAELMKIRNMPFIFRIFYRIFKAIQRFFYKLFKIE